jgi:TonB-dependent receptor
MLMLECNTSVRIIAAMFALLGPFLSSASAEEPSELVDFHIPSQSAASGLNLYAEQAQMQVLFAYSAVKGVETNAVDGRLVRDEALDLLLAETGLVASYGAHRTATVRPLATVASTSATQVGTSQTSESAGNAAVAAGSLSDSDSARGTGAVAGTVALPGGTLLQGVAVGIAGSNTRTYTDNRGRYELRNVPAGVREVVFQYPLAADVTMSVEVQADETIILDAVLDSASDAGRTLEEVIVVGDGRSLSLLAERSYVGKKSVITSTKIGQFPDLNAAEAASRLPGVNIDTTDRGEGRFVSIRGAPPTFNRVKVNGMMIGSPELNGMSVPLDVFPAGQIAEIQVTKSVLPSEDANSVGGEINLSLPTAFGKSAARQFQVKYGQAEVGRNTDRYGGEFVTSSVFGAEDQYGFTASAHYDRRQLTGEAIRVPDWDLIDDLSGFGDVYAIDSMELRNYENLRENSSLSTILEWKPSGATRLYFQASLNQFDEEEVRHRYRQEVEDGGDVVDDGSAIVTAVGAGESTASRITIADIDGTTRDWQIDDTPQKIVLVSFGGESEFENWRTSYMAGYSDTSEHRNIQFLEFEHNEGGALTFDSTRNPYLPALIPVSGPSPFDADEYFLNALDKIRSYRDDDVVTLDADATRAFNLSSGNLLELSFGTRATLRQRALDEDDVVWDGGSPLLLSDSRYFTADTNRDLLETYDYGPSVLREGVGFLFDDPDSHLTFNPADTMINNLISDYTADENVYAAFLQGQYLFGPYTIVAGVRMERTELELAGYGVTDDDEIIELENSHSYTDWFPSVHFRWDMHEDLILRSSMTRTLSRPLFGDLTPAAEIDFDDMEIESGNPGLEPFYSVNYDLSLDWYSDRYGIFGIALFYKDIDGFVVNTEEVVSGGPFDGFTQFSLENAESGTIEGIEMSYTKQFSELPGFLAGTGFSASYTVVDSEVNFPEDGPSARRLPGLSVGLQGQASDSGNFALWYAGEHLFTQIAYATVGDFIDSYGDSYEDRINAGSQWLSFKAIYTFSDRYSLQFNWANINDQRLKIYLGDESRLRDYERTGTTADLMFRVNF